MIHLKIETHSHYMWRSLIWKAGGDLNPCYSLPHLTFFPLHFFMLLVLKSSNLRHVRIGLATTFVIFCFNATYLASFLAIAASTVASLSVSDYLTVFLRTSSFFLRTKERITPTLSSLWLLKSKPNFLADLNYIR